MNCMVLMKGFVLKENLSVFCFLVFLNVFEKSLPNYKVHFFLYNHLYFIFDYLHNLPIYQGKA